MASARPPVSAPFAAFFVCHNVGDYLLQTDFQAANKAGGLGSNRNRRRALLEHGISYTSAFLPALGVVARRAGPARAAGMALLIALPHLAVDDGRLLEFYLHRVKGVEGDIDPGLAAHVDQSLHMVCLWAAAQVAGRL